MTHLQILQGVIDEDFVSKTIAEIENNGTEEEEDYDILGPSKSLLSI